MSDAIDRKRQLMVRDISAMSAAEKEGLFFGGLGRGASPCAVLSASGLPASLVEHVLARGSCNEQLTVAMNNSVGDDVVRRFAETSPHDVVRRQATAKLRDRQLIHAAAPRGKAS